jgi:hypothetical protein
MHKKKGLHMAEMKWNERSQSMHCTSIGLRFREHEKGKWNKAEQSQSNDTSMGNRHSSTTEVHSALLYEMQRA